MICPHCEAEVTKLAIVAPAVVETLQLVCAEVEVADLLELDHEDAE